jgi:hypothetical protein
MTLVTSAFRHRRGLAAFVFMCRCQHEPSAVKHLIVAALMLAHSWYPRECCHDKDCHPVPCAEIHFEPDGSVRFGHVYFPPNMIHESIEGFLLSHLH